MSTRLKAVKQEWKKIKWPKGKSLFTKVVAVICGACLCAVLALLLDTLFRTLFSLIA